MPIALDLLLQYEFHCANIIGRSWANIKKTNHITSKCWLCTTRIHFETPNVCMWYIVLVCYRCWFWVVLPYTVYTTAQHVGVQLRGGTTLRPSYFYICWLWSCQSDQSFYMYINPIWTCSWDLGLLPISHSNISDRDDGFLKYSVPCPTSGKFASFLGVPSLGLGMSSCFKNVSPSETRMMVKGRTSL